MPTTFQEIPANARSRRCWTAPTRLPACAGWLKPTWRPWPTSCAGAALYRWSDRWAFRRRPGRHRADDRPALRLRHAGRPSGLGRGPSGLPAQDPHRPPPTYAQPAPEGRYRRLPAAQRERVRHLWCRPPSTSISAALGMAIAARLQNDPRKSIAVIGDGALTAGMAFEALNHARKSTPTCW